MQVRRSARAHARARARLNKLRRQRQRERSDHFEDRQATRTLEHNISYSARLLWMHEGYLPPDDLTEEHPQLPRWLVLVARKGDASINAEE